MGGHNSSYLLDREASRSGVLPECCIKGAATPLKLGVGSLSSPSDPKQPRGEMRKKPSVA